MALAALVLSAPLALAAPLPALPSTIVAGPGAWLVNYATPAAVLVDGAPLTFLNVDVMRHNVVAFGAFGSGDQPWCEDFLQGQCPLFWSPWTDGFGGQSEVLGLEHAEPGKAYSYYCVPHPVMRGTLVVLPSEAA